jgi:hypothetical protein
MILLKKLIGVSPPEKTTINIGVTKTLKLLQLSFLSVKYHPQRFYIRLK